MKDSDFERLVQRHAQGLYAFLLYRTGDHHLAEELVGDTLERAYSARGRYDRRRASEKTWLITIALNRWRDIMRREGSERAALERLASAAPETSQGGIEEAERRRTVLDGIARLPDAEREVVALSYGGDLSARQVAEVLGVPLTTVQGRLYRGLRHLRDHLD